MDSIPLSGSDIDEVIEIFIENNVLLYHGISTSRPPELEVENVPYEDKVMFCLRGADGLGLSCSTITPEDNILGNTFWPSGIFLKPLEILLCCDYDFGYRRDYDISHFVNQIGNPTVNKCELSIIERKGMNEIVVSDFEVLGVAHHSDCKISWNIKQLVQLSRSKGLNKIIRFGNGFIDKEGKHITAKKIYTS